MSRAIVTGCNLKFLPGAIGLLKSVRGFHPHIKRYCLVPPDEVEESRKVLGDLAEAVAPPRLIRGVPDKPILQLLAARTLLPTFTEEAIAWVDCDVVFRAAAPELWEVPPGQVNAVRDAVYTLGHMVPADAWDGYAKVFPGSEKSDPGFNAGIYALRRADWLDLPERYEAAIERAGLPYYPPGFDQPLLNGIFRGKVNWLTRAFNCHAIYELGIPPDARILHYTANPKPWMSGYGKHNPGYFEWARYGEQCGSLRAAFLRAYFSLSAPRRFGYRAIRKALTMSGIWQQKVGVDGSN